MVHDGASDTAARERHHNIDIVGLRAHATAVGLIQLCEELLNAGVLSGDGLERIKSAICAELVVGRKSRVSVTMHFHDTLQQRIDAVFPAASGTSARERIGPAEAFEEALGDHQRA